MVAETFAIAWRRLDDIPDHAIPWLLGTARRVLANRRRKHHELPAAPAAIVPDHAEAVAGLATLVGAFNRLAEADRETLGLIAWDGLEPREAARVVGCSAATFAVRLHRARRRLEALLAEPASMTEERT